MRPHIEASYLPLATERTKHVVRHLMPGAHQTIDAIQARGEPERIEVDIWAVRHADGIHTYYFDGPKGGVIYLGFAHQVRVAIEEAPTED
jgi:hypothetical protein